MAGLLFCPLNLRYARPPVVTVMRNCCLSADKVVPTPPPPPQSAECDWRGWIPPSPFVAGRLPPYIAHLTMLDNEDFTHPRELTQNPLRKIWMPCKNGHIVQRRGKMQLAGRCHKGCDREMCVAVINKHPYFFILWLRSVFACGDL